MPDAIAGEFMVGAGVIIGADDPIAGAGVIIGADVPMAGAGVPIPPMAGVAIGAVVPMAGEVIAGLVCADEDNQPAKSKAETDKARIGNEDSFFMG